MVSQKYPQHHGKIPRKTRMPPRYLRSQIQISISGAAMAIETTGMIPQMLYEWEARISQCLSHIDEQNLTPLRVRCHRMVMLGRQHHIVWYLRKHDGSTDHWYDQMTITVGLNDGSVRISATHLLKNTAGFGKDVVRSSKRWLSPIQKHADACDCEHRQAQCWL